MFYYKRLDRSKNYTVLEAEDIWDNTNPSSFIYYDVLFPHPDWDQCFSWDPSCFYGPLDYLGGGVCLKDTCRYSPGDDALCLQSMTYGNMLRMPLDDVLSPFYFLNLDEQGHLLDKSDPYYISWKGLPIFYPMPENTDILKHLLIMLRDDGCDISINKVNNEVVTEDGRPRAIKRCTLDGKSYNLIINWLYTDSPYSYNETNNNGKVEEKELEFSRTGIGVGYENLYNKNEYHANDGMSKMNHITIDQRAAVIDTIITLIDLIVKEEENENAAPPES